MDKQVFDLDHQYRLYLKRMFLDEFMMHPAQKRETKRAFIGAFGQSLILMRDDLSKLTEEEAIKTMEDMIKQVGDFFQREIHQQN